MSEHILRPATPADHQRILEVWSSAVKATHDFLSTEDFEAIQSHLIPDYLPHVEVTVAEVDGVVAGFSGLHGNSLEMLFVHDDARGTGVGTALITAALAAHPDLVLDVNEQNPGSVQFYRNRGFVQTGRSELDGDGRPYPILHFAYQS